MNRPRTLLPSVFLLAILSPAVTSAQDNSKNGETAASRFSDFKIEATDWPWWRGPSRNAIAASNQNPPTQWDTTKNVAWKTTIAGKGHGSPIVLGQRVILTTADEAAQTQSVICLNRKTGETMWKTDVHTGGLSSKGSNKKSSLASNSPATDGESIFVNFYNSNAAFTSALNLDGKLMWQKKTTAYKVHQGYGSSPAIYGDLVIVSADTKRGGIVAGLNRKTGDIQWKHDRPKTPNYPSPIILNVDNKDQVLLTGCDLVSGFDPQSGEKLWEFPGATTECVTSTVTNGTLIYTSGGYPKNHMSAVFPNAAGKVAWANKTRVYVPSMLASNGLLYAVADAGFILCMDAATGEEKWKGRLGGTFSSSPVLVGKRIYVTNESGTTFVIRAGGDSFQLLQKNKLGDEVFATPAICDSQIFMRVAFHEPSRQEVIYCLQSAE